MRYGDMPGDELVTPIEEFWYEKGQMHMVLPFAVAETGEITFDKKEDTSCV